MTLEHSFEHSFAGYAYCYDNMDLARTVLMSFDGVIGVGIGPKQKDNKLDTDVVCFLVYVKEKKPAAELEANAFIPREFSGVMTDVVQVGSRQMGIHNQFDARWLKRGGHDCLRDGSNQEAGRLLV